MVRSTQTQAVGGVFIEKHGLTNEASRQGWDETITQMQDRLIYNPSDMAGARWDFMEVLKIPLPQGTKTSLHSNLKGTKNFPSL